jgi:LacI family transcriptional regulator
MNDEGTHKPRDQRGSASLRDVANAAGVSMTTVSHALSGKRHVAPETASRIRALVPRLGYVPYAAARSLQSGKTFVLGLVVPDISNPFFGEIARGVDQVADDRGYGLILTTSGASSKGHERAFNLLRNRSIDGLIYNAGSALSDHELAEMAEVHPVVLVDEALPDLPGIPSVSADHLQGGCLAGEHLRSIGHRNVAIFGGPRGLHSTQERSAGFLRSFPNAIRLDGDYTEASGHARAIALVDSHPEVTAVFATSDTIAFGALEGLAQRGLTVPADVSLVGFDDVDFASRISPRLTTIRQPTVEIGRAASSKLLDLIDGRGVHETSTTLPVRFIARESTTPPRTA